MKTKTNAAKLILFLFLGNLILSNCASNIKANRNANINFANLSVDTSIKTELGNGDFSMIRSCGDSLFLSLKQKNNSPVTILNTIQNKIAKAHVIQTYKTTNLDNCIRGMYAWPDSVSYIGIFKNNYYFDLALLSEKNVQFIELVTVKNKKIKNKIDSIIQNNKKIKDTMSWCTNMFKINNTNLELFELNNKKYYIYSYTNESKYGSTNLLKFVIYNNIISPISFACSNKSIVFLLNNSQIYLGQWEGQCSTDQNNLMLYELRENGPILRYDGDLWEGSESNMDYEIDLPLMPKGE